MYLLLNLLLYMIISLNYSSLISLAGECLAWPRPREQDFGGPGQEGGGQPPHPRQAGHRRRCERHGPDDGRPSGLAPGHFRLQGG